MRLSRPNMLLVGQAEPHRAHRFFFAAAAGAGDAGNAERVIGFGGQKRADGHFAHHFFAHRAVKSQCGFVYAQQLRFGGIAVGDKAHVKPGRAAAGAGELGREQAAGARFGAGNGAGVLQQIFGEGVERVHIDSLKFHQMVSDGMLDRFRGQQGFRRPLISQKPCPIL